MTWFAKANARTHKTLRGRPVDRLVEERAVMRPLPEQRARLGSSMGAPGAARPARHASTPSTTRLEKVLQDSGIKLTSVASQTYS